MFRSKKTTLCILLGLLLVGLLFIMSVNKSSTVECIQTCIGKLRPTPAAPPAEGFDASEAKQADPSLNQYFDSPSTNLSVPPTTSFFQDVPSASGEAEKGAISSFSQQMSNDITKGSSFNIKDFLPQEVHEEWFQTDLSNAKKEMDQSALIDISKFCQGVDTVGQSLKNPSYDLRGNIPNPKIIVSPFLNSSYDPDTNIKSWNN